MIMKAVCLFLVLAVPVWGQYRPRPGGYVPQENYGPPEPYSFGYDARDDFGNNHYRREEGDAAGVVRGSYGYNDAQGLFRIVEYIADANGFRANVRSNEPGLENKSPADVTLNHQAPPPGIQEAYTRGTGAYGRKPAFK